jgi:hypothetical protein
VQLAFSGPNLEDEFKKFKDRSIEDEFGVDKKKAKIVSDGTHSCVVGLLRSRRIFY